MNSIYKRNKINNYNQNWNSVNQLIINKNKVQTILFNRAIIGIK